MGQSLEPLTTQTEDMGERGHERLFATARAKGRAAYKLLASSMFVSICLVLFYRASNIPGEGEEGTWAWMGMLAAEIWFSFYWIFTQSVRWSPVYRSTFKERLSRVNETELPGVDIFVCTADPVAEPPGLVISTVLSVMAYDYPTEKLSVYLSDDAGSQLTFYALWEAAQFAKHWLPFCRRYRMEPRSPAAYFAGVADHRDTCSDKERSHMKNLYKEMESRIDAVVMLGKIPEDLRTSKGFSEWNSGMTSKNHQPIVQIIVDSREKSSIDDDGTLLPTLVYMAREKRPQHHHNFKAGAMNALLRVSSVISNSAVILNVDCDMYSNNAESIRDALCFFLDEEKGQDIGFVQHPQWFNNCTKNDLYANAFRVINSVELSGLDSWGGPLYIGTGCFHRREILCGRKYSKNYKEDWQRGIMREKEETGFILEEKAKSLATCTYELNTPWGKEVGLKYGCAVEDVLTGLAIQCRGWKSVCFNPPRKGFLGIAPTTLAQTLLQHKRWSEGNFQIFLSKYCPFIYGHGKIKLGLQMGYCIYTLWAANSFPTLYYITIPSLCLLKGISLFPKVTSPWFIPFAYVTVAKNAYSLVESLVCGDTLVGWWNIQRMWLLKRITSYLYGEIDVILKLLGISKMTFSITAKVANEDASTRFEQEVMEFGQASPMFVIIATTALFNLVSFVFALRGVVADGELRNLEQFFVQILLCGVVAALNLPIYEALLRRDKGRMAASVTFTSLGVTALACLLAKV
ncbi:cellulose synthase-like protein E6 [Canna indica]|uniref:Cellulose synthase-like protein E6 n=1 Tax=Canna indica TaxID=4628 RepID=A0AAQ3JND2_9LILI|nr:cellulose synthase-like protein E6 [Canna indica]